MKIHIIIDSTKWGKLKMLSLSIFLFIFFSFVSLHFSLLTRQLIERLWNVNCPKFARSIRRQCDFLFPNRLFYCRCRLFECWMPMQLHTSNEFIRQPSIDPLFFVFLSCNGVWIHLIATIKIENKIIDNLTENEENWETLNVKNDFNFANSTRNEWISKIFNFSSTSTSSTSSFDFITGSISNERETEYKSVVSIV